MTYDVQRKFTVIYRKPGETDNASHAAEYTDWSKSNVHRRFRKEHGDDVTVLSIHPTDEKA